MKTVPEIGIEVKRVASATDYTNGRKGLVVEIAPNSTRIRVLWQFESNGRPIIPQRRTWVNIKTLEYA